MTASLPWAVERRTGGGLSGPIWLAVSRHATEMDARRAMAAATRNEPLLHTEFRVQKR